MAGSRGVRAAAGLRDAQADRPPPLTALTFSRFMRIVRPYFLPSGFRERIAAASCFLFLGLSKACNLAAPTFLGMATDALVRKDLDAAVRAVLLFGLLRFLVSIFEELQRLVYLRVKEVAYHELACSTFEHLHTLSLNWHVNKQSGVVLRAMDRGISSASTVVDLLFLRLGPTLVEMVVIVVLFLVYYGNFSASAVLVFSFILYFAVTVCLTRRRAKIRQNMHAADNQATQV
jgi:ABC-type multidrug transport system fused ATPase/permease subunit